MAESKTVTVVPLIVSNNSYSENSILIRDGLWGIVNGTETTPTEGAEEQAKLT